MASEDQERAVSTVQFQSVTSASDSVTAEAAGSSPVAPAMFFEVEHSRGQSPPWRKRRENRDRFPVPGQVQFDYFFGSSPKHAHSQPENLEIIVNHLKCGAFESKRHFHFPITNPLLLLPELEGGQRLCFAGLVFSKITAPSQRYHVLLFCWHRP